MWARWPRKLKWTNYNGSCRIYFLIFLYKPFPLKFFLRLTNPPSRRHQQSSVLISSNSHINQAPNMGMADADRAHQQGSFEHDFASGKYTLHWKNKQDMENWRLAEEDKVTIELIKTKLKTAPPDRAPFWTTTQIYVCSRALSGGRSR